MASILSEIVAAKRMEIEKFKPLSSIERFERDGFFWNIRNRSLVQALLMPGSSGIIAEFKRKSPSKGWFKSKDMEVEPVVVKYNQGAAGISVLTNDDYFGGDLDDLIQTKIVTDIPVLRKDFIIDRWQIAESKAFGADAILLIAACLSKNEVKEFTVYAKSLGLETILEVHDERELEDYCDETDIIGINNRDLKTFKVDIDISLKLLEKIPNGKPAIAESGINEADTIRKLRSAGFRGFLVGERFMKEADPGNAFVEFMNRLQSK